MVIYYTLFLVLNVKLYHTMAGFDYRIRVKLGLYKRLQRKAFQTVDSVKIIKHHDFKPHPLYENDIGLIKLASRYKKAGNYH